MKYLLSILCLFIFSCDSGGDDEVEGCTDANACNFNADATIEDNSCKELDCNNECGGSAVEDECGVCDGGGPEENLDCDGHLNSVCGYDDFEYLTGCGNSVEGGCTPTASHLADIADGYCVMAGYTNAVSYDSITVGPVQNVLNIGCNYSEANPDYYSCDFVGYCNENNPGAWGVNDSWPVISNLVCE